MTTLHARKRRGQRIIHMLVGPIAAGKSTWVDKALCSAPAVVVNDDALFLALHHGSYHRWSDELTPLYKSLENHIIPMAIALGHDVIVDRPHMSRAVRRRVLGIASSLDVPVFGHVFPRASDATHATRRWSTDARGQSYEFWQKAAAKQLGEYEEPSMDEGFDQIIQER